MPAIPTKLSWVFGPLSDTTVVTISNAVGVTDTANLVFYLFTVFCLVYFIFMGVTPLRSTADFNIKFDSIPLILTEANDVSCTFTYI